MQTKIKKKKLAKAKVIIRDKESDKTNWPIKKKVLNKCPKYYGLKICTARKQDEKESLAHS